MKKIKHLLCTLLAAGLLLHPFCALAAPLPESPRLSLHAKSAVLIDQDTGTVLCAENPDEKMPPASITKIMTLLLVMEAVDSGKISLSDSVAGSEHAASMGGTQIWLEPGEVFTVEELIKAAAISSANDASMALAEYVAGSEAAFVEQMNRKAEELGMKNTVFCNPTGLDAAGHLSSAGDVALMSQELLKHPKITEYTTIWMDSLRNGEMGLVNTNRLVRFYEGCTGLKTGTTSGAGSCLSASATRNGLSLIAVVMGCKTSRERFSDAAALLDYGFAAFERHVPVLPEELPDTISVTGGMQRSVSVFPRLPEGILLRKGEASALTYEIHCPEELSAPLAADEEIGKLIFLTGETPVCTVPLLTGEAVEALTFSNALKELFYALWQ